jgi:hypothetical protein
VHAVHRHVLLRCGVLPYIGDFDAAGDLFNLGLIA